MLYDQTETGQQSDHQRWSLSWRVHPVVSLDNSHYSGLSQETEEEKVTVKKPKGRLMFCFTARELTAKQGE